MTMKEKIYAELKKRIEAASFSEITITMKCNGDKIRITPCYYGNDKVNWSDIEYFLVESEMVNLYGDEKLEKVADTIANYDKLLAEMNSGIEALKAHIRKHGEKSDWDFVSDYHKDLFGHRPHVPHSQIIAWANSNSADSARHFR